MNRGDEERSKPLFDTLTLSFLTVAFKHIVPDSLGDLFPLFDQFDVLSYFLQPCSFHFYRVGEGGGHVSFHLVLEVHIAGPRTPCQTRRRCPQRMSRLLPGSGLFRRLRRPPLLLWRFVVVAVVTELVRLFIF